MSAVMLGAQRKGMLLTMPPEAITDEVAARAGEPLDEPRSDLLATISHFGYGAAAGAVYSTLVPRRVHGSLSGIAFGLALYAGSYLGWLPAVGLKPAGQGRLNRQTGVMVLAHCVFGAALGSLSARLDPRG